MAEQCRERARRAGRERREPRATVGPGDNLELSHSEVQVGVQMAYVHLHVLNKRLHFRTISKFCGAMIRENIFHPMNELCSLTLSIIGL